MRYVLKKINKCATNEDFCSGELGAVLKAGRRYESLNEAYRAKETLNREYKVNGCSCECDVFELNE